MRPHKRLANPKRPNEIVDAYWEVFSDVFSAATPSAEPSAQPGEIDRDARFFTSLYVCFREGGKLPPPLLVDNASLPELEIGTHEDGILRALLNTNHQLIILVGDIGRGKTSALKYTLTYLPSIAKPLENKLRICHIDCYDQRSSLKGTSTNPDVSVRSHLDYQINKRVSRLLSEIAKPSSEEFWGHLKKIDDFRSLADFEVDISSIEEQGTAKREILRRRAQERQSPSFYLRSTPYLSITDRTFVVVLDNVDALPEETQLAVLTYAREICNRAHCKSIVTMRPRTWQRLSQHLRNNAHGLYVKMAPPDISAVIQRRTETLLNQIKTSDLDRQIEVSRETPSQLSSMKITLQRDQLVRNLAKLHDYILHPDRLEIIKTLAAENLRIALRLAFRAYQSGRWRTTDMLAPILGLSPEDEIPEHVFIEALFCGRYRTFIGRECPDEGLINVFSNGNHEHPLSRFIRPLILGRLNTEPEMTTPLAALLTEAEQLMSGAPHFGREQARYAIYRLLNANLLESPEVHFFETLDDVRDTVQVRLTSAGTHYLGTLLWDLSYLTLMKDDVYFNSANSIPYRLFPQCNSASENAREVTIFISYLFDQEQKLLDDADERGKNVFTTWISGVTNQQRISLALCRSITRFASTGRHRIARDVAEKLSILDNRIRRAIGGYTDERHDE